MMRETTVKVYEVLYVLAEGPSGPAGDGSFVERFRNKKDAESFAQGKVVWSGEAATVSCIDAPRRLAQRWGIV